MLHMQHTSPMKSAKHTGADDEVISEFASSCLLMRTRLISRVITNIYDHELREFGIFSPQFALLVVIYKMGSASRAEIGRYHHQDRSTLTRNLKIMVDEGWIEESPDSPSGRARPMRLTKSGVTLLRKVEPAWRKAQAQVSTLLGKDNIMAIDDMAQRIMKTQAPG